MPGIAGLAEVDLGHSDITVLQHTVQRSGVKLLSSISSLLWFYSVPVVDGST
jgi:hypothetical protein